MVQRAEAGTGVIRLAWPDIGADELAAIADVAGSGHLTMGPKVPEFERLLAGICGTSHAVAVASGTAALHVAVRALDIGDGDEVIVPAYTFPSTANAVVLAGARPVLVDVDAGTMNVDIDKVYEAVRPEIVVCLGATAAKALLGGARRHVRTGRHGWRSR